jgi:hypothetical protein
MPKAIHTAEEKAQAALDAAETRLARKATQFQTSKALTERLQGELRDAELARDYAAKHPALAETDASVDQGDVEDDGTDEDPFA